MRSHYAKTAIGMRAIDVQFGYGFRRVQFAVFQYETLSEHEQWSRGADERRNGKKKAAELTVPLVARSIGGDYLYDFDSIEQQCELNFERIYFYYRTSAERHEIYDPSLQLGRQRMEINPEGFTCPDTTSQYPMKWAMTRPDWPDAVIVFEFSAQEILQYGRKFRGASLLEYHQKGN